MVALLSGLVLLAQQPPFLTKHCAGCHAASQAAGGLNLDALSVPGGANGEQWTRIRRRVEAGEMPPKGRPRPAPAEAAAFTAWIDKELGRFHRAPVTARRLNRVEYNNTVRDLLGVDLALADDFPQDDSAFGFDNIAEALTVSPLLIEKKLAAAERIARHALFGPDGKTHTVRFEVPVPRRMEATNPVKLTAPAYYSMADYDVTGLSQPGAFHLTHRFPADGEYVFRVIGAGNRPAGSEPGEITFWIDGRQVQRFPVNEVVMSGFERRPDGWEIRAELTAGRHEITAAFPRQFEGLPPRFKGPNPSKLPQPPLPDPEKTFGGFGGVPVLPPDAPPGKVEERRLAIAKARDQLANPRWDGLAVTEVEITGPIRPRKGPSAESARLIDSCGQTGGKQSTDCMRRILSVLAGRAYRRPVTVAELDKLVSLAGGTAARGGSFEEALSVALQGILVSPDFLFRIDGGSPHALASRLSYFLWSTMPDEALMSKAADGSLGRPAVLAGEARRLLADGKSQSFVENFVGQWLEIRRLESVQPDRDKFPDFDDYLRRSMAKETELFFAHVVKEDRSILDLIDGEYTFLNERLARHYGIPGVTGTEFRKVDLKGSRRGGILTHASVLTASSYATRTSPVLRGKWILENLLNAPPPPPPPDVPALDESGVGESLSLRAQLERHRRNAVCASCHARMDPLGFSLENYDAVGSFRTHEGKVAIDPAGALPDGTEIASPDALKQVLRQNRAAFAACLTEKLLTYALGRGPERGDEETVKRIVRAAEASNYRFSDLMAAIVTSKPFLKRGER